MSRERFVTAMTVEPCLLGDAFSSLPAHVTLCPPFQMEQSELGQYHYRMRDAMDENPGGLLIHSVEPAAFGDNSETAVLRLGLKGFAIHAAAFEGARDRGEVDERYAGVSWNPHISLTPGLGVIEPGVAFREAQLFRYAGDVKQVVAVYAVGWASILGVEQWKK